MRYGLKEFGELAVLTATKLTFELVTDIEVLFFAIAEAE
jgi:hypothetical protein